MVDSKSTPIDGPPQSAPHPVIDVEVPTGFKLHTESSASILLPDTADTFLNPVQEFNRDLSIACIRVWSEDLNEKKRGKWLNKGQGRKGRKEREKRRAEEDIAPEGERSSKKMKEDSEAASTIPGESDPPTALGDTHMVLDEPGLVGKTITPTADEFHPQKIVVLEALSATGLRSIRYAKEIPLVRYVIANDLSPAATVAMRRNIDLNGLGPIAIVEADGIEAGLDDQDGTVQPKPATTDESSKHRKSAANLGRVRVNEGDACDLMYSHRQERSRVDVVDLDPYGTAAPFIDAAVQCVKDDGLLCVTCTDLSVLGSTNYPEKCFANYGGIPAKAEYCHEVALRLVLHSLSTSAARYGRYITPLISLSIDFYVRLFVRVRTAPIEVKRAMTKTSLFHICHGCQAHYEEPLGRVIEKQGANSTNVNLQFKTTHSSTNTDTCVECGGKLHVAGPMWSGPIHDKEFVSKVLQHVEDTPTSYHTSARMKGMLTLAHQELNTPFYFTPARVASQFHCECPSFDTTVSALFNAGYDVCRSHACPGSIKTTAPRSVVHDIMRSYILDHPVKMERIKEETAKTLLATPITNKVDFSRHPSLDAISNKIKLVRYQMNPQPNWGPGSRPDAGGKRKDTSDQLVQ
ncbi:RNA methyltransferase tRNA(m5U54)methyltransferase [Tulasnella sp. JGI-2019a]|nr:RNA methyltransferase tRNA(m5U54)methyltransferase [Tulasnella sp. JGI-2019a]